MTRLTLLLASALAACTGSDEPVRTVAPEAYSAPSCWFDAQGQFTGFLLLSYVEGGAIPSAISGKCLVDPGQRSLGLATLRELGSVALVDDHHAFQRAFPSVAISTSVITDQETDFSRAPRLYYFRARVTPVRLPSGIAYAPVEILQLDDTSISFQRFLEMSAADRQRLWQARRRPS